MKNLKKCVAIILSIIMLSTLVTPINIFAKSTASDAETLNGLISGYTLTKSDGSVLKDGDEISFLTNFKLTYTLNLSPNILKNFKDDGSTKYVIPLPKYLKATHEASVPLDIPLDPPLHVGDVTFKDATATIVFASNVFKDITEGDSVLFYFSSKLDKVQVDKLEKVDIKINEVDQMTFVVTENKPHLAVPPVITEKTGSYNAGIITWTVKIKKNDDVDGIVFKDIIDNQQIYKADTFKINNSSIVPEVLGNTLTYTFPAPIAADTVITYQTAPLDTVFHNGNQVLTGNVTLNNLAELYDSNNKKVSSKNGTLTFSRDWLLKNYLIDSTTRTITWSLIINPSALSLTKVTVHDTYPSYLDFVDGSLTCDTATTSNLNFDKSNPKETAATFDLSDLKQRCVVTYKTKIDDSFYTENYKNITNKAWLTFTWAPGDGPGINFTLPTIEKIANVVSSIVSKKGVSYDPISHRITWFITVNSNKVNMKTAKITETMDADQKFISASMDTVPISPKNPNDSNAYVFELGDIGTNTKEITVITESTNPSYFAANIKHEYANTIKLEGTDSLNRPINPSAVTSKYACTSTILTKRAVKYDYSTQKIDWKIEINKNAMPMNSVIIQDVLPTGLTLDTSSVALDSEAFSNYTDVEGTLNFTIGNITTTKILTFTTSVNTALINDFQTMKSVNIANTAKVSFDENPVGVESTCTKAISNNMAKSSVYDKDLGLISYSISINPNAINFTNNLVFKDTMDLGIVVDMNTLKLFEATVGENGTLTATTNDATSSIIPAYNRQDNILTIPLPKTATPYILKYDADIADTSKTNFNNTAEVDGTEFKIVKETKNIITEDAGSIGTAAKRKGSLTITKNDSNDENRKVSGATFKIFLKSTGEEINTGITDEKGIVTFYLLSTNTDYTVKEVASPDMYVLDETPFDVTIGSGATKNIAQTRTNVRKLKVIYNGNGGKTKVTDPENYVPGTSVTVKEKGDTVRAGYAFAEWNTKADGTGDKYLKEGGNQFIITHDTILYAIWTPNNDTKYKIEHYKQNLEDKNFTIVTEDTENKTGKTDDTVSGTPKVYDGFTFDETIPESLKTATIKGDGSLVLKLYYTRNLYKVTYDGNGGKTAVEDEKSPYVYESLVTVKSKGNTKRDKYTFKGWNTSPDGKGVSYKVNGNETFTIIKDTTLYAQWSKNPEHSNNGGHHGGIIIEPSPAPTPAPSPTETPAPSPTETPTPDDTKPELLTGDHIWYLRGYPDNTIRPESNITRAEVSLVFFRLLENSSAIPTVDDIKFSDVSMKDWYGLAIGTLNKLGIIDGYEDGTFRPDEPMTREEAATVAIKFDGLEKVQENPFVDIDDTRWAYDYILSAYKKGWFKGYPDKTFKPDGDILRAEFATLVNNVTNRNVSQDGILSTAHMFSDLTPEHWAYEAMMEASHTHDFDRKNDNSLEIWTQITDTGLDEAYNL